MDSYSSFLVLTNPKYNRRTTSLSILDTNTHLSFRHEHSLVIYHKRYSGL